MSSILFNTKRSSKSSQSEGKKTAPAPNRMGRRISKILKTIRIRDEEEGAYPRRVKRLTSSSGGGRSPRRNPYAFFEEEHERSSSENSEFFDNFFALMRKSS